MKFSYVTSIYSVAGINFSPSTDIVEHLITFVSVFYCCQSKVSPNSWIYIDVLFF